MIAAVQSYGPNTKWLVSLVKIINVLWTTAPNAMKSPIKSTISPAKNVIGLPVFSGSAGGESPKSSAGIITPELLYLGHCL